MTAAEAALSPHHISCPAAYVELEKPGKMTIKRALAAWPRRVNRAEPKTAG